MRLQLSAALGLAALAPVSSFAVDYLSAEQAAKLLFQEADRFEARDLLLEPALLQKLAEKGFKPRSAHLQLRLAWRGKDLLGVLASDQVLGKFEQIGYATAVGLDGRIRGVEILSYRESHGAEIRLPAWRKQFIGKNSAAPLQVGEDIANISGATLSCSHVTEGVKRLLATLELAQKAGLLS
ncbi:Na+-translocating ferredoxin:NAD+ oxidoreductase RnfG subunit [Paucibacter oligotrophus]|uniref:Na+-translocating ferredoxin:NAD+ oxidoreductase RnfG subunit n=1 Tax=Roseateles oligotrophus TaxID=1769250 RepID=A0A840LG18_9BURK|nr:FMN-binding protein [Roseateles oligotrophus]MBB4844237.1 Na+-translocating ferredoxin:NAD+ oxidoreductase RnfG subunit [Roseateles oligotrophus]